MLQTGLVAHERYFWHDPGNGGTGAVDAELPGIDGIAAILDELMRMGGQDLSRIKRRPSTRPRPWSAISRPDSRLVIAGLTRVLPDLRGCYNGTCNSSRCFAFSTSP
jgi:hypothetical protein